MTGKTLKELDVKPGDVVRYDGSYGKYPTAYIIAGWDGDRCYHTRQQMGGSTSMNSAACWHIIARATLPSDAEPVTSGSPAVDYNDGKWHGWNGGECTLHPETVVQWVNAGGDCAKTLAGSLFWNDSIYPVVAFRVTKPYVEPKQPREYWIVGGCEAWDNEADAMNSLKAMRHADIVHVREVTE